MPKLEILIGALALCGCLAAQQTVPPGYLSKEAAGPIDWNDYLGHRPAMRGQISNHDLKGKGAKAIFEISFRQDGIVGSSVARSWQRVEIKMGHTDFTKLSRTWSTNFIGTPTTVFAKSHSWPALPLSRTVPKPWGVGGLRFPFSRPHVYTGVSDLLLDLKFTGGTLANANASWSIALEARSAKTHNNGTMAGAGRLHRCAADSSSRLIQGPMSDLYQATYARRTADPRTADKFRLTWWITGFPAGIPVIQVAAAGGTLRHDDPKYPVIPALGCQNLMLDLTKTLQVNRFRTDNSGNAELVQTAPFVAAAAGAPVYSQALWHDTVTRRPKLSRVGRTILATQPPDPDFHGTYAYGSASSPTSDFLPTRAMVPIYRIK